MSRVHGPTKCRSCGALIEFVETVKGKLIPIDYVEAGGRESALVLLRAPKSGRTVAAWRAVAVSHFETCPNADNHRRR